MPTMYKGWWFLPVHGLGGQWVHSQHYDVRGQWVHSATVTIRSQNMCLLRNVVNLWPLLDSSSISGGLWVLWKDREMPLKKVVQVYIQGPIQCTKWGSDIWWKILALPGKSCIFLCTSGKNGSWVTFLTTSAGGQRRLFGWNCQKQTQFVRAADLKVLEASSAAIWGKEAVWLVVTAFTRWGMKSTWVEWKAHGFVDPLQTKWVLMNI